MIISEDDIKKFEKRYRANLINSLHGYKPAILVGTRSHAGIDNLAIFNSAFHLGANPPLVGLISRPDSVPRHTLSNIRVTSSFTINHVNTSIYKEAHQTSANYSEEVSEFDKVGLTSATINEFGAPFVEESEVKIGLELKEIIPIKWNGTHLIIGEIKIIDVQEEVILSDGSLDYTKLKTAAITGLDTYYSTDQLEKLPYARP